MKKLMKKDRKLLIELIHSEIYEQEQVTNVTYDIERVQHLKKLKDKLL